MKPELKSEPRLVLPFNVKASMIENAIQDVDFSKKTVTGFFNTYWYVDAVGDVLIPGATKKSIKENGPGTPGWTIKHALGHDLTKLPGKIEVLEEKEVGGVEGIYFETKMTDTTLGMDTLINYQQGVYDNHSIGYRYITEEIVTRESKKWDWYMERLINPEEAEKRGVIYIVKEIELYEGSTVGIGANRLTPYLGVKADSPDLLVIKLDDRMKVLEKQLREGTQSDETMRDFSISIAQIRSILKELEPIIVTRKEPTPTPEVSLETLSQAFKSQIQ
jgi:HK97 family phage prohead protease